MFQSSGVSVMDRLAPEDIQTIVTQVMSNQELISGMVSQLKDALQPSPPAPNQPPPPGHPPQAAQVGSSTVQPKATVTTQEDRTSAHLSSGDQPSGSGLSGGSQQELLLPNQGSFHLHKSEVSICLFDLMPNSCSYMLARPHNSQIGILLSA